MCEAFWIRNQEVRLRSLHLAHTVVVSRVPRMSQFICYRTNVMCIAVHSISFIIPYSKVVSGIKSELQLLKRKDYSFWFSLTVFSWWCNVNLSCPLLSSFAPYCSVCMFDIACGQTFVWNTQYYFGDGNSRTHPPISNSEVSSKCT